MLESILQRSRMTDKHAILGILNKKDAYGYEILKAFESIRPFWYVQPGNIYKALHSLETEGYVESHEVEREKGVDRRVYRITKKGRDEVKRWLATESEPPKLRLELLLKIFLADDDNRLLRGQLEQRKKSLNQQISELQAARDYRIGMKRNQRWIIDSGLFHWKAEIKWVNKCLAELNGRTSRR